MLKALHAIITIRLIAICNIFILIMPELYILWVTVILQHVSKCSPKPTSKPNFSLKPEGNDTVGE